MSAASASAFARLVAEVMRRRGLGLRELCRRADVDPSLFSKILTGKRPPPSDEAVLLRLARALETDPVEFVVAAGVLPGAWSGLAKNPELLRAVHRLASGGAAPAEPARAPERSRAARPAAPPPAAAPAPSLPERRGLSEELL